MSERHRVKRLGEVCSEDRRDRQLQQWVRSPAQSCVDNRDGSHEIQPGCDVDRRASQRRQRHTLDEFNFRWNSDSMALEHPGRSASCGWRREHVGGLRPGSDNRQSPQGRCRHVGEDRLGRRDEPCRFDTRPIAIRRRHPLPQCCVDADTGEEADELSPTGGGNERTSLSGRRHLPNEMNVIDPGCGSGCHAATVHHDGGARNRTSTNRGERAGWAPSGSQVRTALPFVHHAADLSGAGSSFGRRVPWPVNLRAHGQPRHARSPQNCTHPPACLSWK